MLSKESPVKDNPIPDLKPVIPQTLREEGTAAIPGVITTKPALVVTALPGGTVREDY